MTDFAGIASSGVQACSAIATYINALKHRDEDLASIGRQAQALESVFQALSQSLTEDSSDPSTSSAAAQVSSSMQTCEAELNSLKQLIARFSDSLQPNARPQDKILQQATKLKYPMRKPDISRIQTSLGVITENLNLALQNLGLRYSQLAISKLRGLEEAAAQASTSLDAIGSSVSALEGLVSPLKEQIPALQSAVATISPLVNRQSDLQLAKIQELHSQSAQSNDALSECMIGVHVKLDGLLDRFQQHFTTASAAVDGPDTRMSVYKLVSRPASLASLCGSLDDISQKATSTISALQGTPTVNANSCPCRQRLVRRSKRVSLWSWGLWDDEVITFKHLKGCQYFNSNGDERSRLRGIKLAGFLKNAIIITFYTSTGAGGHSLGANIEFYATVDRETSPAFRVMCVLEACAPTQKLENLFKEGKAGAKDVDSSNQSLLHAAACVSEAISSWSNIRGKAYCPPIAQLATFLIKRQVPASLRDLRGRLKRILNWYRKSEVEVAAKFTTYLKKYGNALQREHWHAAIRLTTFQSLGIKHTCLTRRPRERELEAEEIAEIQDEDAELLEILESLVEEFEEHAFEAIDAATDRVDRMIAFWNGYWADRMHQVLSELSRADDESKLAAEHLGVSWTAETDEEASESSELEEWDYYFRKIEEIE
ncbi:hypothetical protein M419DRAFT_25941 [Trichoderma reesei RUT C-30]|uniref:Azaphilone pigments biosynthesis cluster protein L N-terminal domain-containing protein n=1 Tax=Hypocrea jecorina (strain ATCC 56765 / BCRC 32924 / NRRL 11460 / Rut C-30) TaxID=1344414 RepID=A0A024S401_HYPJR|nr:hypothetical protein M419DRAFT_25941 [Trichoderma reesei RUT C-30]